MEILPLFTLGRVNHLYLYLYDNGNPEAYQFNVLFTPGLLNDTHTAQVTNIISNTIARGDSMYVMDLGVYGTSLPEAVTQAQTRDTSYAATYWPWVRIIDPSTGKHVWVPASTVIPGVYAFNDKVAAPWFAPAGINQTITLWFTIQKINMFI